MVANVVQNGFERCKLCDLMQSTDYDSCALCAYDGTLDRFYCKMVVRSFTRVSGQKTQNANNNN